MNYLKPFMETCRHLPRLWVLFFLLLLADAAVSIMAILPFVLLIALFVRVFFVAPDMMDIGASFKTFFGDGLVAFSMAGFFSLYVIMAFLMKVLVRSGILGAVGELANGSKYIGPARILERTIQLFPRMVLWHMTGFIWKTAFAIAFAASLFVFVRLVVPYMVYEAKDFYFLIPAIFAPWLAILLLAWIVAALVWYLVHLPLAVDDAPLSEAISKVFKILKSRPINLYLFFLTLSLPIGGLYLLFSAGDWMWLNIDLASGFSRFSSAARSAWSLTFAIVMYVAELFMISGMAIFYRHLSEKRDPSGKISKSPVPDKNDLLISL